MEPAEPGERTRALEQIDPGLVPAIPLTSIPGAVGCTNDPISLTFLVSMPLPCEFAASPHPDSRLSYVTCSGRLHVSRRDASSGLRTARTAGPTFSHISAGAIRTRPHRPPGRRKRAVSLPSSQAPCGKGARSQQFHSFSTSSCSLF